VGLNCIVYMFFLTQRVLFYTALLSRFIHLDYITPCALSAGTSEDVPNDPLHRSGRRVVGFLVYSLEETPLCVSYLLSPNF